MTVYSANVGGIPRLTRKIDLCVTGKLAVFLGAVGVIGGFAVLGFWIAVVVGIIITFLTGPEPVSKIIIFATGPYFLLVGALLGGVHGAGVIYRSMCTCPVGAWGFCIQIYLFVNPIGKDVPIWVKANPGACPVLVPAGCP